MLSGFSCPTSYILSLLPKAVVVLTEVFRWQFFNRVFFEDEERSQFFSSLAQKPYRPNQTKT